MIDMERQNFEKEMKSAFEGAEYSPSENAWVNIELELERAEGKKMRRRIFFYKMLAAASVTFALAVAGAGLFYLKNEQPVVANQSTQIHDTAAGQELAENQTQSSNESASPITARPKNERDGSIALEQKAKLNEQNAGVDEGAFSPQERVQNNALAERKGNVVNDRVAKRRENTPPPSQTAPQFENQTEPARHEASVAILEQDHTRKDETPRRDDNSKDEFQNEELQADRFDNLIALTPSEEKTDNALPLADTSTDVSTTENNVVAEADPTSEADPVQMMFQKLQDREREIAEKANKRKGSDESKHEELWTSLGFAAGGYNGSGSHLAMSPVNTIARSSTFDNQAKASGSSYSVNVSFGRRLTERLVIQGGLSYLNNSTNYVSNQVVLDHNNSFKPATFKDLRASESSFMNSSNLIPTAPHEVSSSLEFISVPIQAGYLIIDRKFGFQLNAGVSTDFFIQNTIDPQGADLQKTTQSRGDESPYRSTNFSGLLGTELTYRLGENYRLSLNPGLRYPFNSIFKDETGIESLPLTFDLGLRFRYIFR